MASHGEDNDHIKSSQLRQRGKIRLKNKMITIFTLKMSVFGAKIVFFLFLFILILAFYSLVVFTIDNKRWTTIAKCLETTHHGEILRRK